MQNEDWERIFKQVNKSLERIANSLEHIEKQKSESVTDGVNSK